MKTYLVGGAIRDKLLNIAVKDKDWVVVGSTAEELLSLGYVQVGKGFPVFLHPETKQEYALARTETKTAPGHTGFKINSSPEVTLEEDLRRRDLTINAIAEDKNGELIDPYGGRDDIESKTLRHVSEAFSEDPLRVIRAARFAARFSHLGFSIADATMDLMKAISNSGQLDTLSAERVWQELELALGTSSPSVFIALLRECGALNAILPEVNNLFGVPQQESYYLEIDTGLHTLVCLEQVSKLTEDKTIRYATLIHSVGKAITEKSNWPIHHGYESLGLRLQANITTRLRPPKEYSSLAALVCEHHTKVLRIKELNANTILSLLESLDAIRRPERLEKFLIACEAETLGRNDVEEQNYRPCEYLKFLLESICSLEIEKLLKENPNQDPKNLIKSHRLKLIAEAIEDISRD